MHVTFKTPHIPRFGIHPIDATYYLEREHLRHDPNVDIVRISSLHSEFYAMHTGGPLISPLANYPYYWFGFNKAMKLTYLTTDESNARPTNV